MLSKATTRFGILLLLLFSINCSSYAIFHRYKDKVGYKRVNELIYEGALERYGKRFSTVYIACRKGLIRIDGTCKKPEEKYQACYLKKGGLITVEEEAKVKMLKHRISNDRVTKVEKVIGMLTFHIMTLGIDYIAHLTHPEKRPEFEIDQLYEQKTENLNKTFYACDKYEIAYRKRLKYSKKLDKLQERLVAAEKELSEVEKIDNAKEIIEKFDPVFSNIENVFELVHIEGVVTGIRKEYVIVKGNAYESEIIDRKFIIYKPKQKLKLYDRIDRKSVYYYLDIEMDIDDKYPIFSPELPRSYKPHEKNYRKYIKAMEYQSLVDQRDKLVKEIKSLSVSSMPK